MQQQYMVEFDLPDVFVDEFIAHIPQQEKQINILMSQGIVKSYALSLNNCKLWLIIGADSEFQIMNIIEKLPLSEFMIPSIMALMFHKSSQLMPELSLN